MGIFCMAQETQTGLCINLEGWDGVGDEREVQKGGNICIPMADSCQGMAKPLQYCNYPYSIPCFTPFWTTRCQNTL